MTKDEVKDSVVSQVVSNLFTNAFGDKALRLQLMSDSGKNLGGWHEHSVRTRLLVLFDAGYEAAKREEAGGF